MVAYRRKETKWAVAIMVLLLLISPVASAAALANTVIDSDRVNENVISIYKNNPEDSDAFQVKNMFPGDSETKTYLVEVSHKGTVTVHFHADIRENSEKLSEVLNCRLVSSGEVLFDGLMREMPERISRVITSSTGQTTQLVYDITVYLDTSVGNEYMGKELTADFRWWVEASENETSSPDIVGPGSGELIAPDTGDDSTLGVWLGFAAASLTVMIILLWRKRQENDGKEGEVTSNE